MGNLLQLTRRNMSFSVDNTDVDFMLDHPENSVLLQQGGAKRRLNVVMDVMR